MFIRRIRVSEVVDSSTKILRDVERKGEPAMIVRHGKPVAFLVPVDSDAGRDLVLTYSPDIIESLARAERDAVEGRAREWRHTTAAIP